MKKYEDKNRERRRKTTEAKKLNCIYVCQQISRSNK
jgi:hypothetical protein